MADASSRATGAVGAFAVVPGPGLTNAMTGIGEALYDSVPIVGIITDIDRSPTAPGRPGARTGQRRDRPAGRQGGDRGPPPGRDPRRDLPGVPAGRRPASRGRPRSSSRSPSIKKSGTTTSRRRPPTPCRSTRRPMAGRSAHLSDRRRRVGIYAGLGCVDAGPPLAAVAELLQAPVATSVSGKGCIPDAHPLAVGWGYGKQGTRAAEAAFKDVDLVLAVGVRYSEVSTANYAIPQPGTLDPRRHQSPEPGPQRPDARLRLCRRPRLPRPAPGRRRGDPPPPLPQALAGYPQVAAGRPLRGADGPRPAVRRPDVLPGAVCAACSAPTSWCSST